MNRSILIILIPAVFVAAGYIFVLRMMGVSPGYTRLALTVGLFFGCIYLLSRGSRKKTNSGGR